MKNKYEYFYFYQETFNLAFAIVFGDIFSFIKYLITFF